MARVVVDVMPKPEILDPQGKAVTGALARLGFAGVTVRQGKRFELEVVGELTEERLAEVHRAAETLLANTVIETFNVRVEEASDALNGTDTPVDSPVEESGPAVGNPPAEAPDRTASEPAMARDKGRDARMKESEERARSETTKETATDVDAGADEPEEVVRNPNGRPPHEADIEAAKGPDSPLDAGKDRGETVGKSPGQPSEGTVGDTRVPGPRGAGNEITGTDKALDAGENEAKGKVEDSRRQQQDGIAGDAQVKTPESDAAEPPDAATSRAR